MRRYTLAINNREFIVDVDALSADSFSVSVGGESYEVSLSSEENLSGATITPGLTPGLVPALQPATEQHGSAAKTVAHIRTEPTSGEPPATATTVTPAPRKPARGKGSLTAPMPGVILEVNVKAGDTVERGQQIAILDAMKMHNVIGAPRAGIIAEVCVAAGQNVDHGDPLIKFQED